MKKKREFSINEAALMASVRRKTLGVLHDLPVAVSRPEIFEDSIVKPESEDLSESSTKEES